MKIVIDIDGKTYGLIQALVNSNYFEHDICGYSMGRIANGTPLPKDHGRLLILSEDVMKRHQIPWSFSCQKWVSEVGLSNATVAIIEADKEVHNE